MFGVEDGNNSQVMAEMAETNVTNNTSNNFITSKCQLSVN